MITSVLEAWNEAVISSDGAGNITGPEHQEYSHGYRKAEIHLVSQSMKQCCVGKENGLTLITKFIEANTTMT